MIRSAVALLAITSLLALQALVASPAQASTVALCPDGAFYIPNETPVEAELQYLDKIIVCADSNGTASVTNNSDQAWRFFGPVTVDVYRGQDAIGAMHRLTSTYQTSAENAYMLPGETVVVDDIGVASWYLDPAHTAQWLVFGKLIDEAKDSSRSAAKYLLALKGKSAAAMWGCTSGAYSAGSDVLGDNLTAQKLVDASITLGTSASDCEASWKSLRKQAPSKPRIPSFASVTAFADEASSLNELNKNLKLLRNICVILCRP